MVEDKAHILKRFEWIAVGVITVLGLVIRLWPFGQLGLTHFDEGIYAMAGMWIYHPLGLGKIDPSLIPYAPPGYPILVGLAYFFCGPTEPAAILVSQLLGTFTIPVVAWLARRTFGPGSGLASAAFAAFSGPHIAFSRMALTDASYLLTWLIGIGLGIRFLERPTLVRASLMGLSVGLVQQFKYNGWLVGAIILLAAGLGTILVPNLRSLSLLSKRFGFGLMGVLVAALVVSPWYRFVEANGGYSSLLRHQRNYLGTLMDWLPSLRAQWDQSEALSGSSVLIVMPWIVGTSGYRVIRYSSGSKRTGSVLARLVLQSLALLGAAAFVLLPNAAWWLGLALLPWLLVSGKDAARTIGCWWVVMSVLTPFYHPYARLWMPIHAVGWIVVGSLFQEDFQQTIGPILSLDKLGKMDRRWLGFLCTWIMLVGAIGSWVVSRDRAVAKILPGPLVRSDTLANASRLISARLPKDASFIRFFGRPSVTFHLAGRVPIRPEPDTKSIFRSGDASTWILLDGAMVSDPRSSVDPDRWEVDSVFSTELSLPTLLDIEPAAATNHQTFLRVRQADLTLYRWRIPRGTE